jgi:hypothetical protein
MALALFDTVTVLHAETSAKTGTEAPSDRQWKFMMANQPLEVLVVP